MALTDKDKLTVLSDLAETIAARRDAAPESSYTAKLISAGIEKCAQKTGEEAVEFAIAAVSGRCDEISQEAADLLYHLLVTLEASGVSLDDVLGRLAERRGVGGLAEKASRKAT
jgi:phosphoribosyl-ATP pyrophosphohydrolase